VGNETHVCGVIALADAVRSESIETVQALRKTGIEHLIMFTSDNEATAEPIARETGVDEVDAELLPVGQGCCGGNAGFQVWLRSHGRRWSE